MNASPDKRGTFDKRAVLRQHPLFAELDPKVIDRLLAYARSKSVPAGASIFARGDAGTGLFAVCSGTVKIASHSADGKDAVFNLLGAGDIFGEIALLDGRPRTANAVALTRCELITIDRRDFVPLVKDQPEIALKLIEVLCARLRHVSEHVEDVLFLDLPGRLAKTLLRLAGSVNPSSRGRKVTITQREIGQIIGMSRESTNKQLREWQQQNWVRLERGGITVLAPGELAEIAPSCDAERIG
jgi:CRP/FNR family transcriptional regulator, cyclic AMP receptor protein